MLKPWLLQDDIQLRTLSNEFDIIGISYKMQRDITDVYNRLKLLNITFDESLFKVEYKWSEISKRHGRGLG